MKTKHYLFMIFLLIFGICVLVQVLNVENFEKFNLKIDFHWQKFRSNVGSGWHIEDITCEGNATLVRK